MPTPITRVLAILANVGVLACGQDRPAASPLKAQTSPERPSAPVTQVQTSVALGVGKSPVLGAYLTDAKGRALYLLEPKGAAGGCVDACLGIWPPLVSGGSPEAADSSLTRTPGIVKRPDGLTQVTYAGHALYYYIADREPGQTLGQHVEDSWGEWYLVSPGGAKIRDDEGRRGRNRRGDDD